MVGGPAGTLSIVCGGMVVVVVVAVLVGGGSRQTRVSYDSLYQ
jgi:hypothetical protein